ncbi:hypothetical protein EDC01DRAFT_199296 [Geopyxis carbonaria]|nr:hypothetical protein EDC01DRAFT_199296 [Geopyxis carbonaria]
MSSFQDVRDVMDISGTGECLQRPLLKKQKTVEKRPDGITRELFALLGQNPPPVAIVENKFKEKPRWLGKANPWIWKGFQHPSRSDRLTLHHWERKTDEEDDMSYKFSVFNVRMDIPEYTDGEYEVLKDSSWTREETDYLFEMCRDYELRFPIIWDRFEFPGGPSRTLDDLKSRYYSACRSLMELRTPMNQMTQDETVMFNLLSFDKDRETMRKKLAAHQFARTPSQCKEEEMLLNELKRVFANQDKMSEERSDLFQRLNFPGTSGSIGAYTGSQGLAHLRDMMVSGSDKNKKRKSLAATQSNVDSSLQNATSSHSGGGSVASVQRDTPQTKKQVRLSEEDKNVYGVSMHDKIPVGVRLRSTTVTTNVKGTTTQKVNAAMSQLGIPIRLTMPTVRTIQRFEQLQTAVGILLETRKLLEKVEHEARVLKAQQEVKDES